MGIYDRDYGRDNYRPAGRVRFSMPPMTPAVKWLLIINIAVFIPSFLSRPIGNLLLTWFSVFPVNLGTSLQIWRLVSYQFMHDGIRHVFFNMLMLYFFGPLLERLWGSNRFLKFYLICGTMGGVFYTILVWVGLLSPGYLVGASGALFGILAAGAILFPNMMVYVMGIFPLPLIILALIGAAVSFLFLLTGSNAGGQAAHLAGMAAGAVYVLWPRLQKTVKTKQKTIKWESKINQERVFQAEVDRILDKVHQSGINSLTRKEKKTLRQASQRRQQNRY